MDRKLNRAEMAGIAYAQSRIEEAQRDLGSMLGELGLPTNQGFTVAPDGTVEIAAALDTLPGHETPDITDLLDGASDTNPVPFEQLVERLEVA